MTKNIKKNKKEKEPEGIKVDMSTIFKPERFDPEDVTRELNNRVEGMMNPFFELVKATSINKLKTQKIIEASVFALQLNGEIVQMPIRFSSEHDDKVITMRETGTKLAIKSLEFVAFAFVSEAWMSVVSTDKNDKRSIDEMAEACGIPGDDPNKKEILVISAQNCMKHSKTFTGIIKRNLKDKTLEVDGKDKIVKGINEIDWATDGEKSTTKSYILDVLINSYITKFSELVRNEKKSYE